MPVRSWKDLLDDAGDGGGSYDPLPEGDYDFIVDKSEVKQAQSGRTMYAIVAKVESGPSANRLVWHNFVLVHDNPTALGFFFRHMNCLGLNREYFATDPADHQVAAALVGRRFRGQVAIRKWQGQDRNEIKAFFPPGGAGLGGPPPGAVAAPTYAAPPPAVAPTPPPPPPAPPAPAPVQQAAAPAPVAETPAQQVQAAPVAPPPPPPAPPVEEAPVAPPAAAPVAASAATTDAPPPPPPF